MRMDFGNKANHNNNVSVATLNIVVLVVVLALTVTVMEVFGSRSIENEKVRAEAVALKAENNLLKEENKTLKAKYLKTLQPLTGEPAKE